jgi:hypothetical protein
MVVFQMAAPRDAFDRLFPFLFPAGAKSGAPLREPLVLTYSRWDRPPVSGICARRVPLASATRELVRRQSPSSTPDCYRCLSRIDSRRWITGW